MDQKLLIHAQAENLSALRLTVNYRLRHEWCQDFPTVFFPDPVDIFFDIGSYPPKSC